MEKSSLATLDCTALPCVLVFEAWLLPSALSLWDCEASLMDLFVVFLVVFNLEPVKFLMLIRLEFIELCRAFCSETCLLWIRSLLPKRVWNLLLRLVRFEEELESWWALFWSNN